MRVSLFLLAVLCAVALCSARGVKRGTDDGGASKWKDFDWSKVKDLVGGKDGDSDDGDDGSDDGDDGSADGDDDKMDDLWNKVKDLVEKLKDRKDNKPDGGHGKPDGGAGRPDGGQGKPDGSDEIDQSARGLKEKNRKSKKDGDKDGDKHGDKDGDKDADLDKDNDKDLDDLYKQWKPKPVTPELLNNASRAMGDYLPLAIYYFDEAEKGVAKFENNLDMPRNETIAGLQSFLALMKHAGDDAAKAYYDFYTMLYRMMSAGFSWETYNRKLWHLTYIETAKRHKEGLPMPTTAEFVAALRADLAGIRDELAWAQSEVASNIPKLDPASLPHPVYVVKEIAAVQYMTDKVGRDIISVVEAVYGMLMHEMAKLHKDNMDKEKQGMDQKLISEVRSLIETYTKLKRANDAGVRRALSKAKQARK